jgi:hypothetical protein
MGGGGELRFQQDELSEYFLPKHQNQIEYFKLLHSDIFESEKRNLPNVIITITSKNDVFLWQENLLSVSCLSILKFIYYLEWVIIHMCSCFPRVHIQHIL